MINKELFVITDKENEEVVSVFKLKFSTVNDRAECYDAINETLTEYSEGSEGFDDILFRNFDSNPRLSHHKIKFLPFTEIDISEAEEI